MTTVVFNLKVLFGNNSNESSEPKNQGNYISFFRIKNKFIFAIYANQKFSFSALDYLKMDGLTKKFKDDQKTSQDVKTT